MIKETIQIILKVYLGINVIKLVTKVKEKYEKTRNIKNNDKSEKYVLRGQRNARYHDKILSNKKKSYNYNLM